MATRISFYFLLCYLFLSMPLSAMTEQEKMRRINEVQSQINAKQQQAKQLQDAMNERQRGKVANYLSPFELERMNQQMTNYRSEARELEGQLNRLYSTPTTTTSDYPGRSTAAKKKSTYSPVLKKDASVGVSIENELTRDSKPGLRDIRFEFVLKESNNIGVIFTGYDMWITQPDGNIKEKQVPLNLRLVPMGEARVPSEVRFSLDPKLYPDSQMQFTIRVKFTGVDDLGNPIVVEDEFLR